MRISGRSVGRWFVQRGKVVAALLVGLILGAMSATALAAVPDENGVIHACWRTNNGSVRIIDTATQSCSSNETPISWNQAGPPGPPGPAGGGVLRDDPTVLSGANFVGWDLAGADLSDVIFEHATFNGADLTGADLRGAKLISPAMMLVDASGINLEGAEFRHAQDFLDSDFTAANLRGAQFRESGSLGARVLLGGDFAGADLTGVTLNIGGWQASSYYWDGSGPIPYVSFVGANFTDVVFEPVTDVENFSFPMVFDGVDFTNANFSGVQFNGGPATPIRFERSIFTGVDLTAADLTYVEWVDTVCPDGTNSADNGDTCAGHLSP